MYGLEKFFRIITLFFFGNFKNKTRNIGFTTASNLLQTLKYFH